MDGATIPVTTLTGFLGSGKTTVLNHLLKQPEMKGALVIVNEFGEIGLDHLLMQASEERFVLLDNGCICCTVRGDLRRTMKDLQRKVAAGELPAFAHVVIETTGLADPAPILHTLMVDRDLAGHFHIGATIATVDAVNGVATLARHAEAAKQVAVADRLLITKTDLASPGDIAALERRLGELAPTATRVTADNGKVAAGAVLGADLASQGDQPARLARWFEAACRAVTPGQDGSDGHGPDCGCVEHGAHRHHGIASYSFIIDRPIDAAAFRTWLDYVTALKGEDLLRVKGLICLAEEPDRPLVMHGVQHVFHPPLRLAAWPSEDRRTRLVFIVRGIPRHAIERTLVRFAAVEPASLVRSAA